MRTLNPPWRRVLLGSWVMIAVLSVVTLTLYVDNKRTKECLSDYMSKDSQNASNRAAIADGERDKFLILLKEITDPKNDSKQRRVALDNYVVEVERNNELRAQNPVLKVPTECD